MMPMARNTDIRMMSFPAEVRRTEEKGIQKSANEIFGLLLDPLPSPRVARLAGDDTDKGIGGS
ncbi:hypothetical protein HDIA_3225 [Hartmannibacter diazotrophicus]|uniref:Uncharacterized protein n=1 Tax=Hartmannibacter diazotrophicus TaxID=1482074 RepID=A0A2C9D922_9HYPH|nr:hypothetical protein HDIA_3225 [Hartmannibacter diazotrophicus]